ncbi:MAG: alanine racemase, partial [Verrucomicrobiota bacterium]
MRKSESSPSAARTWVEVCFQALRANVSVARRLFGPDRKVMAIIKADAYGHGMEQVALALSKQVNAFGVAHSDEARAVARSLTDSGSDLPILLLSPALPSEYPEIVENGWEVSISTAAELEALADCARKVGKQAGIHLVLDTGMGRMGFLNEDVRSLVWNLPSEL